MKISKRTKDILSLLDTNRLLILAAIYSCQDEICNCDLTKKLAIRKNLISYHTRFLRQAGFIEEFKCGRKISYQITQKEYEKVREILEVLEVAGTDKEIRKN